MNEPLSIPIFPLGVVLCPEERLPLHIFEDRYRSMVRYCLETDEPFGIVLSRESGPATVGCLARIERVDETYEDGRMDITVVGERRFKINKLRQEKEYLTADVELISERIENVNVDLRERAITQHMKLLELIGHAIRPHIYQDARMVSFVLTRDAGLNLEQKQELLEMPTENERISFLVAYFEEMLPKIEEAEEISMRIRSNGHFKNPGPE